MSPTVLNYKGYRFFFFSREESRKHIHITNNNGEAKFWIEPGIELAKYHGFTTYEITEIKEIIKNHENEIRNAWLKHFGS
jgi:hypothetical protein